jgi:hypothetical protein
MSWLVSPIAPVVSGARSQFDLIRLTQDVCIGIGLLQSTVPCWLVDRSTFNTQRSTLSKRAQETAGLLLAQGVDLPLYHVPPHLLEPPTTFTVRPISSFLP